MASGTTVDREFDLVIKTDNGYVPIECKYTKEPISMSTVNEEKDQWLGLPFKIRQFAFSSKSGFDEKEKKQSDLLLFDLDEMHSLDIDD